MQKRPSQPETFVWAEDLEQLLRLFDLIALWNGLLLGLVGSLSTILLAVGFYVALKPLDANLAMTALLFRVVESATGVVGAVMGFAALQIYLAAKSCQRV